MVDNKKQIKDLPSSQVANPDDLLITQKPAGNTNSIKVGDFFQTGVKNSLGIDTTSGLDFIGLGNRRLVDIKDAVNPNDAVSLQQLNNTIATKRGTYLKGVLNIRFVLNFGSLTLIPTFLDLEDTRYYGATAGVEGQLTLNSKLGVNCNGTRSNDGYFQIPLATSGTMYSRIDRDSWGLHIYGLNGWLTDCFVELNRRPCSINVRYLGLDGTPAEQAPQDLLNMLTRIDGTDDMGLLNSTFWGYTADKNTILHAKIGTLNPGSPTNGNFALFNRSWYMKQEEEKKPVEGDFSIKIYKIIR